EKFGKYTILERIGVGGMSEVFLAKTEGIEGFERKVALKRIFPDLTMHEEFVRSFIHEARIGGMLYHHNVVQTLDFGKVNGVYFIALEYIEGSHLGHVLNKCREKGQLLPPPLFMQLALQIVEGLEYIHNADVEGESLKLVHRDIKPSNMLISAQGVVKISDFGVVKAESQIDGRTRVGAVKGTIGYMAPEQARGMPIGQAADLYAFGAMLYEMATLKRLYGQGDELTILRRVRDSEFVEPIELARRYIPGLEKVLAKLLAPEARDRYADAAEIAEVLRSLQVQSQDRKALVALMRSLGVMEPSAREAGIKRNKVELAALEPAPAVEPEAVRPSVGVPGGVPGPSILGPSIFNPGAAPAASRATPPPPNVPAPSVPSPGRGVETGPLRSSREQSALKSSAVPPASPVPVVPAPVLLASSSVEPGPTLSPPLPVLPKRTLISSQVREALTGFLIVVLGITVAFAAYALVDMLLSPTP
ncbi:MAG: serine/threonine protein kinase, partial [Myxococcota bacterium]